MPPSAISGTPLPSSAFATLATALICGTPTPATTRVVQMEPGPMPTFTPSAPACTRSRAASPVTMLPPITCSSGHCVLMRGHGFEHPARVAVRGVDDHHVGRPLRAARRRGRACPAPYPLPRATRRRPFSSLLARGKSVAFWKSFTVIMPFRFELLVDHQDLLDAVLVQQAQHLILRRVFAHGDEAAPAASSRKTLVHRASSRSADRGA